MRSTNYMKTIYKQFELRKPEPSLKLLCALVKNNRSVAKEFVELFEWSNKVTPIGQVVV